MRLTGGIDKGHSLVSPKGAGIRPTSDRVREALFNILGPLEGDVVLDLFAGAGTLGLEALSRGAGQVVFVDSNPRSLRALQESLARLRYLERAKVIRREIPAVVPMIAKLELRFSLVFLDPPYGSPDLVPTLEALGSAGLLEANVVVVAEHDRDDPVADRYGELTRVDQRRYGRTLLTFYQLEKATS